MKYSTGYDKIVFQRIAIIAYNTNLGNRFFRELSI